VIWLRVIGAVLIVVVFVVVGVIVFSAISSTPLLR
jgi:hypothetical protein